MELERDEKDFRAESCARFEISMGWYGCCQYEGGEIELTIEECKQLIKELEEHVRRCE